MPLWKKRISKLVANHLQPPKHGGSLVVETGFPTSLVDLFVKNRDRLKKPNSNSNSKKKKNKKRFDPIPDPISTSSSSSSTLEKNSELGLQNVCVLASEKEIEEIENSCVQKTFDSIRDPIPTPSPSFTTLDSNSELGLPKVCVLVSENEIEKSCEQKRFEPLRDPIPASSPSFTALDSNSELGLPSFCVLASDENVVAEIEESGVVGDGEDGGGRCEVVEASANGFFVAFLKMFFVLVLGFGTKKFVVGITMSAFFLLLIEYFGKHLRWLLKPCVDAHRSLVERYLCFVGIKRKKCVILIEEQRGLKAPIAQEEAKPIAQEARIEDHKVDDCFQEIEILQPNLELVHSWLIEGHKMNDTFHEIQIEQPSDNLVPPTGEIQSARNEFDLRSGEEKWVRKELAKKEEVTEKDEAYISDVVGLKTKGTHSGKLRSKIKKLVSNKFHGSKKKQMRSKNVSEVMNEAKKHLEGGELRGLEYCDKSLSEGNGDQVDVLESICSSSDPSQTDMEGNMVREAIGTKTSKNKAYLILIVIVLVGLAWGRGLALALALSWYLLLKSAETVPKFIKVSPCEVSMTS